MRRTINNKEFGFSEFELFFRENFQAASLIAFRYIKDPDVIEDIVQESFITIWEKRKDIFRGKDELKNYLLLTVRSKSISYLRSIKTTHVNIEESLREIELTKEEKLINAEELAVKVSNAITKLPAKCREIFLLAYTEDKTYLEIAKALSISKNTVKTQMSIAYRTLREELKSIYQDFLFIFSQRKFR